MDGGRRHVVVDPGLPLGVSPLGRRNYQGDEKIADIAPRRPDRLVNPDEHEYH
jgi:hypothetical protein